MFWSMRVKNILRQYKRNAEQYKPDAQDNITIPRETWRRVLLKAEALDAITKELGIDI